MVNITAGLITPGIATPASRGPPQDAAGLYHNILLCTKLYYDILYYTITLLYYTIVYYNML